MSVTYAGWSIRQSELDETGNRAPTQLGLGDWKVCPNMTSLSNFLYISFQTSQPAGGGRTHTHNSAQACLHTHTHTHNTDTHTQQHTGILTCTHTHWLTNRCTSTYRHLYMHTCSLTHTLHKLIQAHTHTHTICAVQMLTRGTVHIITDHSHRGTPEPIKFCTWGANESAVVCLWCYIFRAGGSCGIVGKCQGGV